MLFIIILRRYYMSTKTSTAVTASQLTTNWQNGMTAAIPRIQAGVNAVQVNPMEKAAASEAKWAAGVAKAAAANKFSGGCRRITLSDWKTRTAAKVAERMSGGVAAAGANMNAVATQLLTHINSGMSTINAMPTNNLEESIAKQAAWTRHMATFKKQ
jgi:hypothetical protein